MITPTRCCVNHKAVIVIMCSHTLLRQDGTAQEWACVADDTQMRQPCNCFMQRAC